MSDDTSSKNRAQGKSAVSDGGRSLLNRIFAALAHQQRRYILYYLRDHEQAQTDDLAIQIVAWEQDIPVNDVSAEDGDQAYTELVHSHLPKLEDYGLVEYDQRSDTVRYIYPPSLLDEALELASTIENPP